MRERLAAWRGWVPWIAVFVTVTVMVAIDPGRRTVTDVYRSASAAWWAGEDLYAPAVHGYLYLPASAVLFTPFEVLPQRVGDTLWRAFGLVLLVLGVRRLCNRLCPRRRDAVFLVATLLAVPTAWAAIRNGQANVHLTALMVNGALDVAERKWNRASLGLTLAFALKPLALVPILLFAALELRMFWRLLVGVVAVLGLPFLTASPDYVFRQYELGFAKMGRASTPGPPYTEFFGGLHHLGWSLPTPVRMASRGVAALLTLGLCLWARRRGGPTQGAFVALGLAVVYLMAFNPATEANSYVMLAAVLTPFAAAAWAQRRRGEAVLLTVLSVLLWTDRFGDALHEPTKRWLKPLVALAYGAYLVWRVRGLPGRPIAADPDAGVTDTLPVRSSRCTRPC